MKSQLEKMSPRQRARLVRQLELDSDNPHLEADERHRAEQLLRAVKTILRNEEMLRRLDSPPAYRLSPAACRSSIPWGCSSCGARGWIKYEWIDTTPDICAEPDVREAEGDCALTGSGEVVCLACWAGVEPHPTVQ